jgi:hypothetical protein
MSKISWQDVKEVYKPYKTFDGTPIRDRTVLSERGWEEKDQKKLDVIKMFLRVTREDCLWPEEYVSPEKLKEKFPRLLV